MIRKTDPDDLNPEDLRTEENRLCSIHHKWLKELFVAIRGNGDVKHGLEYKVQILLDRQNTVVKLLWIIAGAVIVNLFRLSGMFAEWLIHNIHYFKG